MAGLTPDNRDIIVKVSPLVQRQHELAMEIVTSHISNAIFIHPHSYQSHGNSLQFTKHENLGKIQQVSI